ncbi:DUF6124 family protein [Pseudomonas sp. FP198]|jgi:hypothetical protein|uniref:DUF6124 family protein n=1 Tax=Pseudomonas sp. FP198 TaxID=2954084 RepID=UPI002736A5DA|nr:DUF6124 family protein [Pseudomonas sp. FP198]WLG95356.1 DUF6124 family protein [Pseudomonas sp. FP198]
MPKITPNPPETTHLSAHAEDNPQSLDETAQRALNSYPDPKPKAKQKPSPDQLFSVVQSADAECVLANLSETLASANAMLSDLAFSLEGSNRHFAFGVQQMIELSELLANRALDIVEPRQ